MTVAAITIHPQGDLMQKTVLSLSVAAALAVPGLASAQAPAVPTLDKILEASGIGVSGYLDAGYNYANRNIESGFSTRVFDAQNNSFVLHQAGLTIQKQPKEGFGALLNVTAGKDAGVMHSTPANEATFDVTQGFVSYATGPWHVMAGKYATLHGTEVIASPGNANVSRSILFGAEPFTHTGVRAHYEIPDAATFFVGVNNGWDQLVDVNKGKSFEIGATVTPIKPLSLTASFLSGKEPGTVNDPGTGLPIAGKRDSINLVVSYTVIDPLSVGFEYLNVKQKDAVSDGAGGTKDGKYSGYAFYLSYAFIPKWKASLRAESFDDKDGFKFPGAVAAAAANGVTVTGTKHKEVTFTLGWAATDNFELRGEVRQDKANEAVYTDGTNFSKSLMTYALQGIYKF